MEKPGSHASITQTTKPHFSSYQMKYEISVNHTTATRTQGIFGRYFFIARSKITLHSQITKVVISVL